MLRLADSWVWDSWIVDDGERYHLFFLFASRALHDPERRHHRAAVGHAISDDLRSWTRVQDALVRSDGPAFDDLAIWTGSVVRHPDGTWFMFYTGATMSPLGNVQSIGYATSPDLMTWERTSDGAVLASDPRWYEKLTDGMWNDEAFRDPFVFADPDGDGWHMYITARSNSGPGDERGVIGHATSPDLRAWTLHPPAAGPGAGFGQLEVMEVLELDGRHYLVFNCLPGDLSAAHRATGVNSGVWAAPGAGATGPFDLAAARPVTDDSLYVGRFVRERGSGRTSFLAFVNKGPDGAFVGEITDPFVATVEDGRFTLTPA